MTLFQTVESQDQFVNVDTMNLTSAVTTALLLYQDVRYRPMTISLSNVICTIARLLKGPGVQVFAATATLNVSQCDMVAVELDVLTVHAVDSKFRSSYTKSDVQLTVRPSGHDSGSTWNHCQFLGALGQSIPAGVTLRCLTSDWAQFSVRISFANTTFQNHFSSALTCGSSDGYCLCGIGLFDTAFLYNSSPDFGGAIRIDVCRASFSMGGNMTFVGNSAELAGGAVYLGFDCFLSFASKTGHDSVLFDGNYVRDSSGFGGAMSMRSSFTLDIIPVTVTAIRNAAVFGAVLASYGAPAFVKPWNCSGNVFIDPLQGTRVPNLVILSQSWQDRNLSMYTFCDGTPAVRPGTNGSDISAYPAFIGISQGRGLLNVTAAPLRAQPGLPIQFTAVLLDAYLQPLERFQSCVILVRVRNTVNGSIHTVSNALGFSYVANTGRANSDNFAVRYAEEWMTTPPTINFTLVVNVDPSSVQPVFGAPVPFLPTVLVPVQLEPCAPGLYLDAAQGVCLQCSTGTYSLLLASRRCFPCPEHANCSTSGATAAAGYWLFVDVAAGQMSTHLCPQGFCVAGACAQHRDITSPLCAQCSMGYYDWGGSCVPCDESSHEGFLVLLLLGFLVYVLIQHVLFQRAGAAPVKTFFLFFQTLQLMAQSTANWMPVFVGVLNLQPSNLSPGSSCLYPASWYTRIAVQMVSPLAILVSLSLCFSLVWLARWLQARLRSDGANDDVSQPVSVNQDSNSSGAGSSIERRSASAADRTLEQPLLSIVDSSDSASRKSTVTSPPVRSLHVGLWSWLALMRSIVAISLLAFQLWVFGAFSWVFGAFSYLDCVPVAKYRVMSTIPAIDCDSHHYRRWIIVYYVFLPLALVTPVLLGVMLWKLRPYLDGRSLEHSIAKRPDRLLYILGVCYEGYRPQVFWFELVPLAQRLVFAATGAVSDLIWPHYPDRRLELLTLELVTACLIQVRVKPFVHRLSNTLTAAVFAALAVICHLATYYTLTVSSSRDDDGVQTALVVAVLVPSVVLLLLAVIYIVRVAASLYANLPRWLLTFNRWVSRCLNRFQDEDRLAFQGLAGSIGDAAEANDDSHSLAKDAGAGPIAINHGSDGSHHQLASALPTDHRQSQRELVPAAAPFGDASPVDEWGSFRAQAAALE